jgi:hypothetical protein
MNLLVNLYNELSFQLHDLPKSFHQNTVLALPSSNVKVWTFLNTHQYVISSLNGRLCLKIAR